MASIALVAFGWMALGAIVITVQAAYQDGRCEPGGCRFIGRALRLQLQDALEMINDFELPDRPRAASWVAGFLLVSLFVGVMLLLWPIAVGILQLGSCLERSAGE